MKVKDVLSLLSYGTRWQLIGARTGKKLCSSYNTEKTKQKYMECECTNEPIFCSLYAPINQYSKTADYAYPMISIWVSGE